MSDEKNWYVVTVDNVDETTSRFIYAGIPCQDMRKRFNKNEIAFPTSYTERALTCLEKQSKEYFLETTGIENTLRIKFQEGGGTFNPQNPGDYFEGWDDLLPVISNVYTSLGIQIIPDNPHGRPKSPISRNGGNSKYLYIHFWSTPVKTAITNMKSVYGIRLVGSQQDALTPSNVGISIKDNGKTIAEYVNDNLYILFDLPHARGNNVKQVFARIIGSYLVLMGRTREELDGFYHAIGDPTMYSLMENPSVNKFANAYPFQTAPTVDSLKEHSKELFVEACSRLYTKTITTLEDTLNDYDTTINEHNQILIKVMKDREILSMELDPLRSSLESRKLRAGIEYDKLCALPHVRNVIILGKTIQIFTDLTIAVNPWTTIGEFRIDIHTEGNKGGISAKHLTTTHGRSSDAKIVKINCECCLEDSKTTEVLKLLAGYHYVDLAQMMINYIESNPSGNILFASHNPDGLITLDWIFTSSVTTYHSLKDKIYRYFKMITEPQFTSQRELYINSCSKLYKKNIVAMESSFSNYTNEINEYNQKLIEVMRDREILLMRLDPLRSSADSKNRWADIEYDKLCASPHVKDVIITGNIIQIITDTISINYKGESFNIGEFKIELYTDGSGDGVKVFNLTKPRNGRAHPHVLQSTGYCCLGNIKNGMLKLLAGYEYVVLAQMMITFLQSYNPDNTYEKISTWR